MFSRNVALIIGINDYTNGISPLQNAVNDAKRLVEILRGQHEYRVWVCLNQVATLHNLNKLLVETLPQQVTKDDRLLFYFAGHGIALNGDDGPQGYLIPQDAKLGDINTYLSMVQLHECLSQLPCRHFLGILDCCFAGAFKWSSNRDLLTAPEVIHQERYDRFISDPAWQVITSAAYDQKALDAFNFNTERGKAGNHSPFAAALIEALAGKADAYPPSTNGQPPGDGVITATELYLYLRDIVEPATQGQRQRQTPGIWPLKKHDKGEYIFLTPGHILNLPPAPPLDASKNPYRGLKSFEEEHSQLFFGRTQLVEKLQNLVKTQPLTLLLGASGSGKSSLVKAGLIPQLRQDKTETWYILPPIRPGEAPLQALNNALKSAQLPEVAAQNPQKTLAMSIDVWAKNHPNSKLLLFIDQSEEIVTLCQNEIERKEFLQEILKAIDTHNHRLRVVLSLRSDFEPQLRDAGLQFVPTVLKVGNTVLKNRWQSGRFIVSAMTRAELRQAIEKPAETRVMFFQPYELVEQLIDEVADMPGALPLLSFALSELYLKYLKRQRDAQNKGITIERSLTQEDYEDLGGVIQSLTQRADEEYEALVKQNSAYAQIIRHVMLRMVALGGGELARRRVPLSELEYPQQKNILVKEVIERFTNARLLVKGEDAEGKSYVEPAHDALVRGWQKLLAWKQEDEESLILQRRLTPSAMEWKMLESKQQPSGFQTKIDWLDRNLYGVKNLLKTITQLVVQSGRRSHNQQEHSRENPVQFLWNSNPYLDVLNEQLKSGNNWFNQVEVEFVQRSVLQKRKNSAWRWRITFGVMLGLSGLTLLALVGQRQALEEEIIAERQSSETYLQSNQPILDALVSSLRAGKLLNHWLLQVVKPSEQQQIQITRTLRKAFYTVREDSHLVVNKGKIASVFWKKGQLLLATLENNGTVSILERNKGQLAEVNVPPNSVTKVAFNRDGTRVAIARKDGIILLWDWRKTPFPRELKAHEAEVTDVVWSPDGSQFASLTASGVARIWDSFGNKLQEFNKPQTEVVGISFDLNNQFLRLTIGRDNGIVCLWDSTGRELEKFTAPTRIKKATMSPDGKRIAITYTSEQNGVSSWLWNWEEKKLHPLGNDVLVSFSLDGRLLATTGFDDGTVRLRNWFGEQEGQEFQGHQSQISSLNFRSDGELLATGSNDGKVKLWRVQSPQLSLFKQLPLKVTSASFNSNGTQVATLGTDGKIRILDLSGNPLKVFSSEYDSKGKLSWSPNNKQLAVADKGKILLLDASSGKQEGELPGQYEVSVLRFSPNSQKLALMENNRTIRTFNLSNKTEETPFTWGENIPLSTVVWRQDGNQVKLFVAVIEENDNSKARSIRMWDIKTSQQIAISFHKYLRDFKSIHFNNDGTLAAVAKPDGTVSIWYMEGDKMGELKADTPSLQSVSFSPRGNVLAVIASDGTMKLWQLGDLNQLMIMGCDRLRNYLENNPNVIEGISGAVPERQEARHLCSDIGKKKLSD